MARHHVTLFSVLLHGDEVVDSSLCLESLFCKAVIYYQRVTISFYGRGVYVCIYSYLSLYNFF